MTTRAWLRNQAAKYQEEERQRQAAEQRAIDLENMQLSLMQREVEAAERRSAAEAAAAKSAAPLAKEYMQQWNNSLKATQGMFNQAMQGVNRGWEAIEEMQSNQFDFSGLHKDLETEWNNIKDKFGGLTDQAIEMAGEEMTQRRELGRQLTKLAQPDYEGVAGRAMADVTGQAALGRQAEARRLSSLGIDPTSGRGRAMMNTIQGQEALAKAQAATQARRGEKERVTGVTGQAMQLIDPSKTAGIATNVQALKGELLGQRVGLSQAEAQQQQGIANAVAAMSGAAGSVARGMGETVTAPLGEAAGVYSGMALQGGYDPISGRSAMPTTRGTSYGSSGMTAIQRMRQQAGLRY